MKHFSDEIFDRFDEKKRSKIFDRNKNMLKKLS